MTSRSLADRAGFTLSRLPTLRKDAPRIVVLCYHSVHPSATFATRTAPALFEQHMRWLRESCLVIPFADVARRGLEAADPSRPTVAVTFDDGFADNYTHALPVVRRYEIPATFFVATGLIERDPEVLAARSWRGWRDPGSTMSWDQILEMRGVGMAIGSHGHTHTALSHLSASEVDSDLSRSKRMLEERLGEAITMFAFPKGRPRRDLVSASVDAARDAGYETAATILLRGVKDADRPMTIPRFPIAEDSLDSLRAKVTGKQDLIGIAQERAPLGLLRRLGS